MRKILFAAIATVMVCGCVNNDCSETLQTIKRDV